MSDDVSQEKITFRPSGREKMRCTVDGLTIYYTYADEAPNEEIPEGMRRVTFLEPDPHCPRRTDRRQ